MENFKLKGAMLPYEEFKKHGFDFNVFEYMADLIINDEHGESIFKNAFILEGKAIMVNNDKTSVFVIDLKENKNVRVIKIDRSNIN
jgi:tricorn protease-like protein